MCVDAPCRRSVRGHGERYGAASPHPAAVLSDHVSCHRSINIRGISCIRSVPAPGFTAETHPRHPGRTRTLRGADESPPNGASPPFSATVHDEIFVVHDQIFVMHDEIFVMNDEIFVMHNEIWVMNDEILVV